MDLPDGRRIDYAYDAKGQRTQKRVDGRVVEAYQWLDPLRLEEFFDGQRWWRLAYLKGRTPVGVTDGEVSYLFATDQLGTTVALADLDGNVVQTMQYDAFGNLLATRGSALRLPLGFAGGLFDADTGLTRFVWRDYDADTGRFTALDPMGAKGGDTDWYGYCVDDPVNRADAWGLSAIALPGPFGPPVTPVFIPGTPENDQFTKGTLDFLKGFGDIWGDSDEPDNDPNTYESEHTTNQTPSNRNRHEEGQARKQRDKGGEKKDQRPEWRGNPNKRRRDQSDEGSSDSGGFADNGFESDTEDEA